LMTLAAELRHGESKQANGCEHRDRPESMLGAQ
jgi:hypothetical protein